MTQIFSLCNQKGGVGKTTTAVNLATCLAQANKKILLVDLDPQGNATSGIGLNKNEIPAGAYELLNGEISITEVTPLGITLIPNNCASIFIFATLNIEFCSLVL